LSLQQNTYLLTYLLVYTGAAATCQIFWRDKAESCRQRSSFLTRQPNQFFCGKLKVKHYKQEAQLSRR